MARESAIKAIHETMFGLQGKLIFLQEQYSMYHDNYSAEAMELLGVAEAYNKAVSAAYENKEFDNLSDSELDEMVDLSRQVSQLYELGVDFSAADTVIQKETMYNNELTVQGQNKTYTEKTENLPEKQIKSFFINRWEFIFFENIGANGGTNYNISTVITNNKLNIFASGKFIADNLVNDYDVFGSVTLIVDSKNITSQNFTYPKTSFIWSGNGKVLGNITFEYDFSKVKSIELEFEFGVILHQDSQHYFVRYKRKKEKIK